MTARRCPAAHFEDPTPCDGPPVVTVLDAQNAGADGCEHHGARLLASLEGGRVYALPDAPAGAAIRVFKAAAGIRPFPWMTEAPRTEPSQLSHAENRRAQLPVYGPTEPLGDEEHTPDVVVRVDFLMSREQITTALGIAWAEMAGDRDPESLTVREVRHEVEAYLSVQAFHELDAQMDRDRQRTFPPAQQAVMQLLADAVERAYPPRRAPAAVQEPRYGEGTVTLTTLDRGEITIPEPEWCTGHEGQLVGPLAEVSHDGPHMTATVESQDVGPVPLIRANLTHAPYLVQQPEPHPLAYVEGLEAASFDAAGLRALVTAGRTYLDRLEAMADQLDDLAEEGPQ